MTQQNGARKIPEIPVTKRNHRAHADIVALGRSRGPRSGRVVGSRNVRALPGGGSGLELELAALPVARPPSGSVQRSHFCGRVPELERARIDSCLEE